MDVPEKLPIDARVIALNETDYFEIEENDKQYIKEIRGAYFYDKNRVTHCCELTPSYNLYFLYHQLIPTDKWCELNYQRIGDLDKKYCMLSGEDVYIHCDSVDRIEKEETSKPYSDRYYVYGTPDNNDDDYERQMDDLREYLCANHKL